jgi:transcriptional regulator with XRE-family HTH domain
MEELPQIIKKYREQLGLTIDQVSEKTKIRKFILSSIESGEYTNLPPVYGKSFVKSYLTFLEIPEEEFSEGLEELSKQLGIKKTSYNPIKSNNYGTLDNSIKLFGLNLSPTVINYSIYSAIVIIVAIIVYVSIFSGSRDENQIAQDLTPPTDSIEAEPEEFQVSTPLPLDSILLEAFAIDSAWIKVDIDGNKVEQALMIPNMKKKWKAKDYFIIHQGNIGGLEIKRNGKLLEPFGSPGRSVKNVKVTEDRVIYQ